MGSEQDRDIDTEIAREIFGHEVWTSKNTIFERTPSGERPLHKYSSQLEHAWEVAEKSKVTLLPVGTGRWFAFTAGISWDSPMHFVDYLQTGKFGDCGASEGESPSLAICQAALISNEKRKKKIAESGLSHAARPVLEVVPDESAPTH